MKNGRRIGKTAELEAAGRFNRLFGTSFRRSQQFKGSSDSADIIDDDHPELCPEIKRRSDFSKKLHAAVEKARSETGEDQTAFVLHRIPGERWLLTVDLIETPELVARLAAIMIDRLPEFPEIVAERLAADILADALSAAETAEAEGIDGKRLKRKGEGL